MGWVLGMGLATAQPVAQIPVEVLFKSEGTKQLVLSPDQKFMAAITPRNGRQNLAVIDVEKRTGTLLTNFEESDVRSVRWVNNNRLIYTTGDQQGLEFRGDGGLFAINRDATLPRTLFALDLNRTTLRRTFIVGGIKGNDEEVLVQANDRSAFQYDLYRMNVNSGRKTPVNTSAPPLVVDWVVDGDSAPRATLSSDGKKKRWWSSYLVGAEWKQIAEWDEQLKNVIIPVEVDPLDKNTLYVASNVGRDTMAYFKFDLSTGQLGALVYGDDRYDVATFNLIGGALGEGGDLIFGGDKDTPGKLIGLHYQADKPRRIWFDEEARKAQALVDAALPGAYNVFNMSKRRVLVFSASDTNPGEWYLFDREKRQLEETGVKRRPSIDPKQMAPMRPVSWTARDGVRIDGYLTLPLGHATDKPVPLILHPHGGPWAKDNWGFNTEVQFMANRGYAVLQPNFRGSTGYGARHLRLSYKHWGDTMIDDMLDGVDWAIKQGYADADRVAVYGASYGGYAALMAMVRQPDLFKWGINYVGVTDMTVHQDTQWAQLRSDFTELAKVINGDQRADKAMFDAQSPARHVDRIAAPVFHAYGGQDYNVDFANGRTIRAAFDSAKKPYEWMFERDAAHGYSNPKHVIDFYTRFDKFMRANTPAAK